MQGFEIGWPCHYRRYFGVIVLIFFFQPYSAISKFCSHQWVVGGNEQNLSFGLFTISPPNSLTLKFGIYEGVTSNTDAAHLAEVFSEAKCSTKVDSAYFSWWKICICCHYCALWCSLIWFDPLLLRKLWNFPPYILLTCQCHSWLFVFS